jgi:hypothetical protein
MTLGQWLGKWSGEWFGAVGEADPNAMVGSASFSITTTAILTANSVVSVGELVGSASFSINAYTTESIKSGKRGIYKNIQTIERDASVEYIRIASQESIKYENIKTQERIATDEYIRTTQTQPLRTSNTSASRQSNKQTISR